MDLWKEIKEDKVDFNFICNFFKKIYFWLC